MQIVDELMKVALLGSAWVLYLLFALSVVSLAAVIERVVFFAKNARGAQGLDDALPAVLLHDGPRAAGEFLRGYPSVEARVLISAIAYADGGRDAVRDALESALARERPLLERGSTLLGTLGNNAPFVGLFGTVIGVVEAFHHLGDGSDAAMESVMAGIAEALIATGVGIFVAIPAVVAFNWVQKRVAEIEHRAAGLGALVCASLGAHRLSGTSASGER